MDGFLFGAGFLIVGVFIGFVISSVSARRMSARRETFLQGYHRQYAKEMAEIEEPPSSTGSSSDG